MKSLALALAAVSLMATPALAADPQPSADKPQAAAAQPKPAQTEAEKKAKAQEKLICTREASTDSFLTKRVCRTQAQIDEERRAAQRLEDDRQLLSNRLDNR
jgi:hypothetical protein